MATLVVVCLSPARRLIQLALASHSRFAVTLLQFGTQTSLHHGVLGHLNLHWSAHLLHATEQATWYYGTSHHLALRCDNRWAVQSTCLQSEHWGAHLLYMKQAIKYQGAWPGVTNGRDGTGRTGGLRGSRRE
jgi:hypothetical protein